MKLNTNLRKYMENLQMAERQGANVHGMMRGKNPQNSF